MKAILVKMQCVTNLHVGNGDVNYNIIDNEVERDPITGNPTINSSGVKGALRQYFAQQHNENVNKWFGDEKEKTEGQLKILAADIMAMPMRASRGTRAFYLVSPQSSIERFEQIKNDFAVTSDFSGKNYTEDGETVEVEGIRVENTAVVAGDKVYVLDDNLFGMVDLPVMARNCLEDGKSKNLWYEEIVPHQSTFIFPVVVRDAAEDIESLREFKNAVDGKIIQFGGNASIGYGLCRLYVAGEV